MRKILLLYFILIFYPVNIFCAPCYGTRMPEKGKIFLGLQTHNILERDLEKDNGYTKSLQNFLLLSYGLTDFFSIDLKAGIGNIKYNLEDETEIKYPVGFAGGYGFRLRLYQKDNFKSVFGFQHISVHPRKTVKGDVHRAILDDWQVSCLLSYDFKKITPYIGGRWSRVDYIHKVNEDRKRIMSTLDRDFGFIFGFDIPITEKYWLNIEGNFFDGQSCAFSINYSF